MGSMGKTILWHEISIQFTTKVSIVTKYLFLCCSYDMTEDWDYDWVMSKVIELRTAIGDTFNLIMMIEFKYFNIIKVI